MPVPKDFSEEFVIYHSREDKAWIAHGMNTDQLGVGADPIAALRDGIKAVSQVVSLCKRDPTAVLLHPAPDDIAALRKKAKEMPEALVQLVAQSVAEESGAPSWHRRKSSNASDGGIVQALQMKSSRSSATYYSADLQAPALAAACN